MGVWLSWNEPETFKAFISVRSNATGGFFDDWMISIMEIMNMSNWVYFHYLGCISNCLIVVRFSKDPLIEQLLSTVHTITSKRAAGHLKSRENIVRSQHEISPSIMNDKDQTRQGANKFWPLNMFFQSSICLFLFIRQSSCFRLLVLRQLAELFNENRTKWSNWNGGLVEIPWWCVNERNTWLARHMQEDTRHSAVQRTNKQYNAEK